MKDGNHFNTLGCRNPTSPRPPVYQLLSVLTLLVLLEILVWPPLLLHPLCDPIFLSFGIHQSVNNSFWKAPCDRRNTKKKGAQIEMHAECRWSKFTKSKTEPCQCLSLQLAHIARGTKTEEHCEDCSSVDRSARGQSFHVFSMVSADRSNFHFSGFTHASQHLSLEDLHPKHCHAVLAATILARRQVTCLRHVCVK